MSELNNKQQPVEAMVVGQAPLTVTDFKETMTILDDWKMANSTLQKFSNEWDG